MDYHKRKLAGHVLHPESLMMGYGYDPALSEGSVKVPIFQTSTFVFRSAQHGKSFFELVAGLRELQEGEQPGLIYSRFNNPDLEILEDRLTVWDGAEAALVFASGMAAIATTLLSVARPGDVVFYNAPIYGGTETLLMKVLPQFGIQGLEFAGNLRTARRSPRGWPRRGAAWQARRPDRGVHAGDAGQSRPTIWSTSRIARSWRRTLHDQPGGRAAVIVDNTFLGPLWQSPLSHGADHGRVFADEIRRRAQRRRGRGGAGITRGAEADPIDAQRVRHDERPAYRVAADAQPGDAGAADDAGGRECRQGGANFLANHPAIEQGRVSGAPGGRVRARPICMGGSAADRDRRSACM